MAVAGLDANSRQTLTALSNANDGTIVAIWADPVTHRLLIDNAATTTITVGSTTIASGTTTRILYDNAGVLGEYTITGTGTVVAMQTSPTILGHPTVEGVTSTGATGTGKFVFDGTPTLVTPVLGVATATSINGLTITSTTGTLTMTNGKTLSVVKTMTLTAADDTGSYTFPTGTKTLVATDVATLSSLVSVGTITTGGLGTGATLGGVTMSIGSDAVGDIYSATASNVLSRIAAVATGQVLISKGTTTLPAWSASATLSNLICTNNAITASGNAATVPVTSRLSTVTNNSAATLTITITTASAVDGQLVMVRVLDSSAVAQTITWVNTENSTVSVPTTSNGSTTLPLTVGFQYNSQTSKWRCLASA